MNIETYHHHVSHKLGFRHVGLDTPYTKCKREHEVLLSKRKYYTIGKKVSSSSCHNNKYIEYEQVDLIISVYIKEFVPTYKIIQDFMHMNVSHFVTGVSTANIIPIHFIIKMPKLQRSMSNYN